MCPCSIHVNGEGEGSKATLIAWLKRRAAQDFGHGVVGKPVWICWCADAQFYRGTITYFNPDTGKHQVCLGLAAFPAYPPRHDELCTGATSSFETPFPLASSL